MKHDFDFYSLRFLDLDNVRSVIIEMLPPPELSALVRAATLELREDQPTDRDDLARFRGIWRAVWEAAGRDANAIMDRWCTKIRAAIEFNRQ